MYARNFGYHWASDICSSPYEPLIGFAPITYCLQGSCSSVKLQWLSVPTNSLPSRWRYLGLPIRQAIVEIVGKDGIAPSSQKSRTSANCMMRTSAYGMMHSKKMEKRHFYSLPVSVRAACGAIRTLLRFIYVAKDHPGSAMELPQVCAGSQQSAYNARGSKVF